MIRSCLLFFLGAILFTSCTTRPSNELTYVITPIHKDSVHQLQVNMSFMPSSEGTTILEYPNEAWGQGNLHDAIKSVEVTSAGSTMEMNKDSGWIVVNHPKSLKKLELYYVLQQDFSDPITSRKVYRPIIQPEYFHLFSHNLFMVPKTIGDTLNVRLKWEGLRSSEVVHNSFGSKQKEQFLEAIPKTKFLESIFAGGDFTINEIPIKNNKVYLATRGDWIPFSVNEIKALLTETLQCQRNFWEDHSQPYFTVTMQPIFAKNGSGYQGTGLTNSFATSFTNNEYMDISQMVHLFNHELMHNWIGGVIKNVNEEEQYWFSEGFTEYYTFKNVAKNGIGGMDGSYFINSINDLVRNLYSLSIREAPNSEMNYENFWSNPEYQKLPYYRGALFAFYLDNQIRKRSHGEYSLDDLMRIFLMDAKEKNQRIDHGYFVERLQKFLPDTAETSVTNYIEEGNLLPLADFYQEMDLDFEPHIEVFDLGFEFAEDRKGIQSVHEDSAAMKAGLRPGDKIVSQSIWFGSIEIPVEIGVVRNGKQLNFSYLPIKLKAAPKLLNSQKNIETLKL